ncbi:MAG: radical SAM protein, partial [Saprospiraceae bacterium]|nr:radical SAM protein [Saprospiraceae bacterium]
MIQWRNFNIDPDWYLQKVGVEETEEPMGVRTLMRLIKEEFPQIEYGYFNPPIERTRGNFATDFAH